MEVLRVQSKKQQKSTTTGTGSSNKTSTSTTGSEKPRRHETNNFNKKSSTTNTHGKESKAGGGGRKGNRVAPTPDPTMKRIPPRLVPLVETQLKELRQKEKKDLNQVPVKNEKLSTGNSNLTTVKHGDNNGNLYYPDLGDGNLADEDEVVPEITVSLWQVGGHPDLIPILHHFVTGEVNMN